MRSELTKTEKILALDEAGFPGEPPEDIGGEAESGEANDKGKTQAIKIIGLVDGAGADVFRNTDGDPFATIPVGGHTEVLPLDGKDCKTWLCGLYYKATGKAANNEAIGQAVAVLSAKARFDRPDAIELSTRTAERDCAIWYDLTNPKWQAVKITAEGWAVCDNPPIIFNRYRHQSPQSIPQPGGDIRKLLNYVNMRDNQTLFLCWLVSCFIPNIPHALLILFGEKGAAKSTACEFLKAIIDPSSLSTLTITNDPRSMAVSLQQHYFLPFDNVSYISDETSDTLCRAITGGGIQQRRLYTNAEDTIFTFKRVVAINGINNVATRSDLLDRSLLIELERINESDRRELSEIQVACEADRAAILGGILDTLSKAMAIYPTVKLSKLQRMADFTRWCYAIGEALGGLGQTFLDEYATNRASQNAEVISADPVATLIVEFMTHRTEWSGTVSVLYGELTGIAADHNISTRNKSYPIDPARLSKRLNGIRSNLEGVGIGFERYRRSGNNCVSLRRADLSPLPPLPPQATNRKALDYGSKMELPPLESVTSTLLPLEKPSNSSAYGSSGGSGTKNTLFTGDLQKGRI